MGRQYLCLLPQQIHLNQFQARDGSQGLTALKDAQGFCSAGQCLLGQRQALSRFAHGQIGVGRLGDEAEFHCFARGLGGQVACQGGFIEAGDASPEIDLPAGKADVGLKLLADEVAASGAQVCRQGGSRSVKSRCNGGQAIGL